MFADLARYCSPVYQRPQRCSTFLKKQESFLTEESSSASLRGGGRGSRTRALSRRPSVARDVPVPGRRSAGRPSGGERFPATSEVAGVRTCGPSHGRAAEQGAGGGPCPRVSRSAGPCRWGGRSSRRGQRHVSWETGRGCERPRGSAGRRGCSSPSGGEPLTRRL